MSVDDAIERCAKAADDMALELEALKPKARKGQYDRQSGRQIDYAIRMVRRLALRIRSFKSLAPPAGE